MTAERNPKTDRKEGLEREKTVVLETEKRMNGGRTVREISRKGKWVDSRQSVNSDITANPLAADWQCLTLFIRIRPSSFRILATDRNFSSSGHSTKDLKVRLANV